MLYLFLVYALDGQDCIARMYSKNKLHVLVVTMRLGGEQYSGLGVGELNLLLKIPPHSISYFSD